MFDLKITKISEQSDKKALEALLRKIPGLTANQISMGLRYQPFKVFTTAGEEQAHAMKNTLEKLGAACEIENAEMSAQRNPEADKISITPRKEEEKKFQWRFLLTVLGVLVFLIAVSIYFSNVEQSAPKHKAPPQPPAVAQGAATAQVPKTSGTQKNKHTGTSKSRAALKQDLVKNSYDTEAWKALAENLEAAGDTAAARAAKDSYDKAVRTQMVLSSLARTFGNNVRVEITETSVYYRTSKDFSDSQFNLEAERLRDSLSARFPGKRNLVIENYTSDNRVQRIILEPNN